MSVINTIVYCRHPFTHKIHQSCKLYVPPSFDTLTHTEQSLSFVISHITSLTNTTQKQSYHPIYRIIIPQYIKI